MGIDRLLARLRAQAPADLLGSAAVAVGIVLVAIGMFMQESRDVGAGGAIRALGGVLLLGGLAAILFWEPRRRGAVLGWAYRIVERYKAGTAHWPWTDRMGFAGILIGLALLPPAVVVQALFRDPFGLIVIAPGLASFWAGVALLIYERYRRWRANRTRTPGQRPPPSRDRERGRGRDAR